MENSNITSANTTVATSKYLDLISVSAQDHQRQELEFRSQEAEQAVAMCILETKKTIFEKERELTNVKRAIPHRC